MGEMDRGAAGEPSSSAPAEGPVVASTSAASGANTMEITPLGAGQEVGRSCLVLKYKGKTIMFDCGVHPAYSGLVALPYFDSVDPSEVDLLLVTHFHIDHSAALPYFLFKTNFKGRVFMTHSTKAIYRLMLADFARVGRAATEEQIFDENDLQRSMERIEVLDYHQEVEACGVRFWSYAAGHVLGAAMFMVDIAGVKFLYTGDYSREEDRHLKGAEMPSIPPDIICVESTYGVQVRELANETQRSRFGSVWLTLGFPSFFPSLFFPRRLTSRCTKGKSCIRRLSRRRFRGGGGSFAPSLLWGGPRSSCCCWRSTGRHTRSSIGFQSFTPHRSRRGACRSTRPTSTR